MDPNDNSSKENCIPQNVQNREPTSSPANKPKRPATGSRPRPPLPQKPPVAKKPNIPAGSQCVSKPTIPCTISNSTSTSPPDRVHTPPSSRVPSVSTTSADKTNKLSLNNNNSECNNPSESVSVKDRTRTLGLYAAGKSLFYVDQKFEHAPAPQTKPSSSAHVSGKDTACAHVPVSESSTRNKSGKLRLPLIGFKRNSRSSSSMKVNKSEWYTEFEADATDVAGVQKEVHASTNKASSGDSFSVDQSCEPATQVPCCAHSPAAETKLNADTKLNVETCAETKLNVESKLNAKTESNVETQPRISPVSNTISESGNKPESPKPSPASRKIMSEPKHTTSPPVSRKVPPQPVPRKRKSILPKTPNDELNTSVSGSGDSEGLPKHSLASKDSGNEDKDNKVDDTKGIPQNIQNETITDDGQFSSYGESDAVISNGTSEKTNNLEDTECETAACGEVSAKIGSSINSSHISLDGATEVCATVVTSDGHNAENGTTKILPRSDIPPPVPKKTKRKVLTQNKFTSVQHIDSDEEKCSSMESKSSHIPDKPIDQLVADKCDPNDESNNQVQSDVVENNPEPIDEYTLHEDDIVIMRNKNKSLDEHTLTDNDSVAIESKSKAVDTLPQYASCVLESRTESDDDVTLHHPGSDVLKNKTEVSDSDTFPQPESIAQVPDTCDMLKEIEDLLTKTLGDVGIATFPDFLNDSEINSEDSTDVKDTKVGPGERPKSESFSGVMPSRPPRPKRDATKKLKQSWSLDQPDYLHSDTSSCDSANESIKKQCPPKPKRNLLPRVNRSRSDVSGMKSVIEQLEISFDDPRPAIPPRNESFGSSDRPPPLPPRNNSRSNSMDLSTLIHSSSIDTSKSEAGKAPPFPKPPRRVVKRPSRKAPPPPPYPPGQKPDLSASPSTTLASVCVINKDLESEKHISYRTSEFSDAFPTGPTSADHDYHEIPDSECTTDQELPATVKDVTPPPELPPRIVSGTRPTSQMSSTNDSDTGSVRSEAVGSSKLNSDDSSSICSSQSSMSPAKPQDSYQHCSVSLSGSPALFAREHRLSSVSSTSGSFENVNRMNDLSSGSDSEQDDENKQVNKKAKKARYIAKEIMESEAVFVDVLKLLNIDFRVAVSKEIENVDRPVIPSETLNKILDYLPQLQSINEDLLKDITERFENWDKCQKIADVFVKKGPFLKLYSSYIRNFENATTLLDESCKKYASFATCVKEFEKSPRCANLALKHYMLKPIQRIPQYKLLLQDYLKNLSPDSPDYSNTITALNIVSEVADHANESMRHGDEVQEMMEIQHSLIGQFEVIQPGRSLLKKGELMKLSRKEQQPRMFFLFTDVLLYTTPTATGYRLNNILPLIGMKVAASDKPTTDEYGNEFSILSVQRSFTISARTPRERTEWMTALSEAIKEMTLKRDTFHSKEKGAQTFLLDKDFVLGHKAPLWVPDRRVTMCMLCLGEFTITWRRHHCRACGRIVCGYCSENKAPLRYLKYRPDRVCDECFEKLHKEIEDKEICGETAEDMSFPSHDGVTPSKVSLHTIKERFQKIRWSGRGRKKYAPSRAAVLKEVKANDEGSSMSGYLRMFRNKKWKRYWFVVKDNVLYTYKASEDMAAIESNPLLGFEVSRITDWFEGAEPDLVFQLTHQNTAPLIFRSDSATATTKWVTVMGEASVCNMK